MAGETIRASTSSRRPSLVQRFAPTRGVKLAVASAILILAGLVLTILSPLLLNWFAGIHKTNWALLSDIGQTYGAISALASSVGLVGIAASIAFQAAAVRAARDQYAQMLQFELVRMSMEQPYLSTVGTFPGATDDQVRAFSYCNLWLSHLLRLYTAREISDQSLRSTIASQIFSTQTGRDFWESSGRRGWANAPATFRVARYHRFLEIINSEYEKARAAGPPSTGAAPPATRDDDNARRMRRIARNGGTALAIASGGALIGWLGRRALTSRRPIR